MEPTLAIGDSIVVDMRYFNQHSPQHGDIIAFRHHGIFLVKRVEAVAGEEVSSKNGQITVKGIPMNEPYAHHSGNAQPQMNDFGPVSVPVGQLFVVGDNRDLSFDSRLRSGEEDFGPVMAADVAGLPLYILRSKQDRTGNAVR